MDEEPLPGSKNFVESNGIKKMSVTTSRGMSIFKNCGISFLADTYAKFLLTSNLDIAIIPINENYKSVTINNYDSI